MEQKQDIFDKTADEIVKVAKIPPKYFVDQAVEFFDFVGDGILLLFRTIKYIFTSRWTWVDSLAQMASIGVNSLSLVMITVAFSGMVLSLYSSQLLVRYGVGSFIGGGLALSIVREMAPVLTAVVVAARSGSAIAAEIGSMKVTEQIDALRSLSINPVHYLVAPRIVAAFLMFPMMTVFANVTGMIGGYVVALLSGVASGAFISSVSRMLTAYDISMGLIKAAVFGLVVALVCCQQGLRTKGGATGVGQSTTNAVVTSIVLIYILNFFMASVMFGQGRGN